MEFFLKKLPSAGHARGKTFAFAFTLAEILITLMVVGVIAAMTIPNLVKEYQKTSTIERLKKVYSTFSTAANQSIIDNGEISSWDIPSNWADGQTEFNKYFRPYLKIAKYCGVSQQANNECWPYIPKGKDGSTQGWVGGLATFFILADGTAVRFSDGYTQATIDTFINIPWSYPLASFFIDVDINAAAPPNTYGKDIFTMYVTRTKGVTTEQNDALLYRQTRAQALASCNANTAGSYSDSRCLNLIILDGWRIADDYIW